MRRTMTALIVVMAGFLSGCGGGGGDAASGTKVIEDMAAALDEAREACSELLEAGEIFSADDVETCSAAGRGGYECDGDGTDAWGIDDEEGQGWIIAEDEMPIRESEVDDLWGLYLERCPSHPSANR